MGKVRDDCRRFLEFVLPPLGEDEAVRAEVFGAPRGRTHLWPAYTDIAKLGRDLVGAGQRGNAHLSPVTFKKGGARRVEDARRCQVAWADLDVCAVGEKSHAPSHYPTLEEAVAALDRFSLKPHVLLSTGHGALALWRLAEPVADEELRRLIRLVRGMAQVVPSDPNVAMVTQLIRCPGTKNFDPRRKKDGQTHDVTLLRFDPELPFYKSDDFAAAGVPEVEAKSKERGEQMSLSLDGGRAVGDPPISARMKELLNAPGQGDYPSPSEADAAVITGMLGGGLSAADAAATFMASPRGADAAERKSNVDDYLDRTLRSAQAKVAEDRAGREHTQVAASASTNGNGPSKAAPPTPLAFPEDAWHGVFEDYRHAMATTEAPDAHHFAAFLTVLGWLFGRRIVVVYERRTYPNVFNVLVGATGVTRKTGTMRRAVDLALDIEPSLPEVGALGSAEGLLETLATAGMSAEERYLYDCHVRGVALDASGRKPKDPADGSVPELPPAPPEGRRLLLAPEEWATMLSKARQESTGNITPILTALYDCPTMFNPPTRANNIKPHRPTLSVLTASAPVWVENLLTIGELISGFCNRFGYWLGEPKAPVEWPEPPRIEPRNRVVKAVHDALACWAGQEHEFSLSEGARRVWSGHYVAHRSRLATHTETHAAVVQRCPTFAIKLALTFAALRADQPVIEADDLERAASVADYLEAGAGELLGGLGDSKDLELEKRLLKRLADGAHLKKRDLHQAVGGRFPAERFNRTIEALLKAGIVQTDSGGAFFDPAASDGGAQC